MEITSAIQKGAMVYAYNGNRQLFVKQGTLHGYTATSLSVVRSNTVYTFDEKGRQISTKPAR